jgi:hypothetical protein
MEVLAWRFLPVTPTLDAVVTSRDSPILHLHVGWRVSKLTLGVGARAFVPLELTTHLQLEPA